MLLGRHSRLLLLSFLLLLRLESNVLRATKFDFATLTLGRLKLLGDAHLRNGTIRLTRDLPVPFSGTGRALFADPIPFPHPFATFFSFSVSTLNPSSVGGGLTFLLSPDDHSLGDAGPFLGLLNSSSSATNPILAVEFDTLMDEEFDDVNGNHVGIDLGSMVSAQVADLDAFGVDLKSGDLINAWIEYTHHGILRVFVSYSAARPADPVISFPLDLDRFIDDGFVYVGFSASTQGSTEMHSIEWWSFSSPNAASPSSSVQPAVSNPSPPPSMAPAVSIFTAESPSNATNLSPPSSPSSSGVQGHAAIAGAATAGAFVVASFAGLLFWVFTRRVKSAQKFDNLAAAAEIMKTPREFSYRELSNATMGFDSSRIIGHGAFGTVYKGIIPENGAMVAVKRCIQNSGDMAQGRAEFLSELSIIAGLRHRNLLPLQGWCHEKGEILLVYDFMLHSSLDKALFDPNSPPLPWRCRRTILIGVASALAYLHRECERQVIHRDVKSSNIMLDENYHARLGDFGLARQVDHDKSPDATVAAGTMGYLAPEYLLTGRATEKTDVFSFGAVVLEVACGRRPIESNSSNLVEWVWGMHREGRILEVVDNRIEQEFEEGEMRRVLLVGLACSSPDPLLRPGMRGVVQMLTGEAEPPFVPATKPSMSFSTNHQLLLSLQDSVSDWNAMGLNVSSSSSSSSSLRSTLRGGGGGSAV
ncbi:L-type lectin-domain containing receptor kinase VIII.1-like [Typha latifolia]|uniref:L-type lectin-domain containing receptor kinase VIII.1-like n=1 Tax=Typha latifolia TaxID=4733 RepID=UPI003C2CEBCE